LKQLLALGGVKNLQCIPWDEEQHYYRVPLGTEVFYFTETPNHSVEASLNIELYRIETLAAKDFSRHVFVSERISPAEALDILREYLLQKFIAQGD
jgi:hypothetical protein